MHGVRQTHKFYYRGTLRSRARLCGYATLCRLPSVCLSVRPWRSGA